VSTGPAVARQLAPPPQQIGDRAHVRQVPARPDQNPPAARPWHHCHEPLRVRVGAAAVSLRHPSSTNPSLAPNAVRARSSSTDCVGPSHAGPDLGRHQCRPTESTQGGLPRRILVPAPSYAGRFCRRAVCPIEAREFVPTTSSWSHQPALRASARKTRSCPVRPFPRLLVQEERGRASFPVGDPKAISSAG